MECTVYAFFSMLKSFFRAGSSVFVFTQESLHLGFQRDCSKMSFKLLVHYIFFRFKKKFVALKMGGFFVHRGRVLGQASVGRCNLRIAAILAKWWWTRFARLVF